MNAITISEIVDPVKPIRGALARALEALPVNKAVIVTGTTQRNLSSMVGPIGRRFGRKYSTASLPDGRVQIAHIA